MASTFPCYLIFGICGNLPKVPEGWTFFEDQEDFLAIQNEAGKMFIARREDGWLTITPASLNESGIKNESRWVMGDEAEMIKLCIWPDKQELANTGATITIEAEWQKYRAAAMKDYRLGKLSERDMRQAFFAGCFVAFQLQGSLIGLPIDQGAAILTALMDESTKACLDHVKAALAKRN